MIATLNKFFEKVEVKMKAAKFFIFAAGIFLLGLLVNSCALEEKGVSKGKRVKYEPSWESLAKKDAAPQWFEDAVLGIYFHWGIYSVPGNTESAF